jgi:hypothetical protein
MSSDSWPSEREARGDRRRLPLCDDPKPEVVGSIKFGYIAGAIHETRQGLLQHAVPFYALG